jgi:1-acyl-sn-glycerol-3-phosphate acyltransferase
VPVIPVAMIGTNVVNPPGKKMLRFGRVTVRFGEPMDFSRFDGLSGNHFIERAVIDEVIYELMGLSGQEYVDIYAASLKNGAKAGSADASDGEDSSPDSSDATRIPETAAG